MKKVAAILIILFTLPMIIPITTPAYAETTDPIYDGLKKLANTNDDILVLDDDAIALDLAPGEEVEFTTDTGDIVTFTNEGSIQTRASTKNYQYSYTIRNPNYVDAYATITVRAVVEFSSPRWAEITEISQYKTTRFADVTNMTSSYVTKRAGNNTPVVSKYTGRLKSFIPRQEIRYLQQIMNCVSALRQILQAD